MRPELPSGTVTFLFTDIVGSTRLLRSLGPDAYAEALAEHRRVLRAAFAEHDGVEVDTQGDAFFVAFPTAPGAVAAACAGQEALEPGPIRVRMGLHTGTPTLVSEGYVGVDVHRGARVAALAHGGQVLLTEATATLVDGVALSDLGRHRLKDFDGPAHLLQLGTDRHPPLRTPGAVLLPTPATRFLGREHELYDAASLVLTQAPAILTILGPGGTGKTRFAIELSRLLAEDADGGTVFVPLAALRDPALVLAAIADALGADDASADGIASRVGERRTHLLLDNVEQLLPAVAAEVASLVARTSFIRLLVTSREALNVAAETRFDLPPLVLEEAVSFFVERAQRVNAAVEPTQDVTMLCERLDRLPLALELAAARTRLLQPQAILARIEHRLDLPAQRDADPRHATLRATIAWSHDLLSPDERDLFASFAIFRGSCTLDAAEEVCGADLDTLASLIDKSLVRRRADASGSDRYWMLETIREFAAARLDELPDETRAALRLGHARRMLVVARSASLQGEFEPTAPRPEILRPEIDDVRAALDWAIGAEPILAAELTVALGMHWTTQAIEEGLARTQALLALDDVLPPGLRAELLTIDGGLTIISENDQAAGEPSYYAAIDLYRGLEDTRGEARLLSRLAVHAGTRGEREEAHNLFDRARRLTEGLDVPALEAQRLGTLGRLAETDGDLERAFALYAESAEVATACGFMLWATWSRTDLAAVALRLEWFDVAASEARTTLATAWEHGDRRSTCWCLILLARVALARGENERAGRLWGASSAEIEETGILAGDYELPLVTKVLRSADDPAFDEGVEIGRASSLEDAVAVGLDSGDRGDGSAPIQTEP